MRRLRPPGVFELGTRLPSQTALTARMRKHQTPSAKLQRNFKLQPPPTGRAVAAAPPYIAFAPAPKWFDQVRLGATGSDSLFLAMPGRRAEAPNIFSQRAKSQTSAQRAGYVKNTRASLNTPGSEPTQVWPPPIETTYNKRGFRSRRKSRAQAFPVLLAAPRLPIGWSAGFQPALDFPAGRTVRKHAWPGARFGAFSRSETAGH